MNIVVSEFTSGFADSTHMLCNYLGRQEKGNKIIYLSDKKNPYFEKTDKKIKCIPLFQVFGTGRAFRKGSLGWILNRFYVAVRNAWVRNRYIKKVKPDVTLVMATLSTIDQFFLGKLKKNTKVIMTVHDVIVPQKSLSWGEGALKRTYRIADGLVTHSERNKRQLMELFGVAEEKIQVIHHGIQTDYKKKSKEECLKELRLDGKKPVLLFYGGIRQSKGLDILIKALKGVDCKLIIAGSMPYNESFDKYDRQLEKNKIDCLKYIEFTEDSFRDILFQASDFIVLPYKEFYSQSGVFMQAIHYRRPVIATDVSSFSDYIEEYQMGYCCEPGSSKALRQVIEKALTDWKTGSFDREGLEQAAFENSWEKSAEKYLQYFREKEKE